MNERYAIFKVYYDTYENVARDGDKPPVRLTESMPCEQALARLQEFVPAENYRFSAKPV